MYMNMDGMRALLAFILQCGSAISEILRELNAVECI